MSLMTLSLVGLALSFQAGYETPTSRADLLECRFAKAGTTRLVNADAVALFFSNGIQVGRNPEILLIDPESVLLGEVPSRVSVTADGMSLTASSGRMRPIMVLLNDGDHQGDEYAASVDFVFSRGDAMIRFGFCIRVRGQEAIDRHSRILAGFNFGNRQ